MAPGIIILRAVAQRYGDESPPVPVGSKATGRDLRDGSPQNMKQCVQTLFTDFHCKRHQKFETVSPGSGLGCKWNLSPYLWRSRLVLGLE